MKYVPKDTSVTFSEVPDEVSLCVNISNCPCRCVGCHSPYLREDIGEKLTQSVVDELIRTNSGISCICFMGGDANKSDLNSIAKHVKENYDIKTAWYSGRSIISPDIDICNFDYIKVGPYIEKCGPLNVRTTNQIMYKVENGKLIDITNKFWL